MSLTSSNGLTELDITLLSQLFDVDITNPQNSDVLTYQNGEWVNGSGTAGSVTSVTGTPPLFSSGGTAPDISITQADTATDGYLSSTDWNTFNGKQTAGNYITALTGDVTASGPGSVAATLATVNSDVGSFTNSSITVNAKGLITAASSGAAPEVPLTFSTGLTRTVNTVTSNLSTGVSGGQTVYGGTTASENLTLQSTTDSTRGTVDIERKARIHTATGVSVSSGFPYNTIEVPYSLTFSGTSPSMRVLATTGTMTYTSNPNAFGAGSLFNFNTTVATTGSLTMSAVTAFVHNGILSPDATGTTTNFSTTGFLMNPTLTATTSGTVAAPFVRAFSSAGVLNAGWTVTNWVGLNMADPSGSSGTITNMIGVDIAALAGRSSTLIAGVRSAIASGTGKWFLYSTGTADSSITGNLRLGDNTAPTSLLDLAGKLTATNNGLITKYNNIATVSGGVPAEIATVDLTAQGAAIGATTLYAVPAAGAGMYIVSFVAKVTRAATSSSTLGGTNGFRITYTDQDDSVAVTTGNISNISGATLTGNTTQIVYAGSMIVNAKASTNIQYSMDYTSSGATTMQFNLHIKLEAL